MESCMITRTLLGVELMAANVRSNKRAAGTVGSLKSELLAPIICASALKDLSLNTSR